MPKIDYGTEFCAVFEDARGQQHEEFFVADDVDSFAKALQSIVCGSVLLTLYRSVDFEIKA